MARTLAIYEPKGRALEYSPLACNLYSGCIHGCKYCYGPKVLYRKREVFHGFSKPRDNILKQVEKDCRTMEGDEREILLCFTCDPYQPGGLDETTRKALLIFEKYNMKVQVLTKGGNRAARDFDILKRNNWKFGTTLIFVDNALQREWEPNAASLLDRVNAIKEAKKQGIYTWVSVEPVIDTEQALMVMKSLIDYVDFWKVGKINYDKRYDVKIDWKKFVDDTRAILPEDKYYIKKDTLEAARRIE